MFRRRTVELALGLSVPLLTDDGRADRRLARAAFADRLPPEILHRRSKGEMTAYFGRQAAASIPFLRDHLLGGRLAARGLIDRVFGVSAFGTDLGLRIMEGLGLVAVT